ncbi:hypothetical protein FH583_04790 [Leptospira interrogans]|uniref:hypothetical protein n=1 Tax=Leptospira interrogans TaxID=173 RepID=UPI0018CC5450|nr:hypothetical protein [Leptospira interrogans]UML76870.1 hypothetical protein FH583_04790 [Leptospira interrogans]
MNRVGKLNTTLSYGSRWKTQHNAFLWVALENSTQRFPMGRVVGRELVLQRICRNSDRFILRSNTCGVGYGSMDRVLN